MSITPIRPGEIFRVSKKAAAIISSSELPKYVPFKNSEIAQSVNDYYQEINKSVKLSNAKRIINVIGEKTKAGITTLTNADENWVSQLRRHFGRNSFDVANPDNPKEIITVNSHLTPESINGSSNGMQDIQNALHVMVAATNYKPHKVLLDGVNYTVHNKFIADNLKPDYSSESFEVLTKYLDDNKVFDMSDDPNFGYVVNKNSGLVKTCVADENWEMDARMWVTDSMQSGYAQKRKRPETWSRVMTTVSKFYDNQAADLQRIIDNPKLFRVGGPMDGVPHIFIPETLKADPNWFNNKRLESAGLAMREMCQSIVDGLAKGKDHGFKTADSVPDTVIKTIERLSQYFKAIDYPTAPSAGNWEELALKGGLTSDTNAIMEGYKALRNLAFNKRYSKNPEIMKIRERLNIDNKETINDLINRGQKRVRETYLAEAPGIRENDASLAWVAASDIKLADNPLEDILKHTAILDKLERTIVRENGMIRYAPFNFKLSDGTMGRSPDSYLNLNYFTAVDKKGKINLKWKEIVDKFGSKDASEPDVFNARAKLSTEGLEAQWFMTSVMSTGYSKQLKKLLKRIENRNPTDIENYMIGKLYKKATEYENRFLSTISAENPSAIHQLKANGKEMPAVTVTEAHQFVSDIEGKPKAMYGVNSRLAWALTEGLKSINEYRDVLKMMGK